jgi:hypothetical protein
MKPILLALFLFAIQVCHAQTEWVTYKCEKYSISHPSAWGTDTSHNMGVDLFIISPPDSVGDKFRENVNVVANNVEGMGITLDSFVNASMREIKSLATDLTILESKVYKTGNKVYHKIDFTAKQGIFSLHFVQYYFASSTTLYTVTLTTEAGKFNQYKTAGVKMLDSFLPLK